mgnify:CR=1 FL=1|jgi:hypothetical protein
MTNNSWWIGLVKELELDLEELHDLKNKIV